MKLQVLEASWVNTCVQKEKQCNLQVDRQAAEHNVEICWPGGGLDARAINRTSFACKQFTKKMNENDIFPDNLTKFGFGG